ncbi:MAG: Crp/Fnr family transcriptional regulator [Cellvibrionaceae bacterium]
MKIIKDSQQYSLYRRRLAEALAQKSALSSDAIEAILENSEIIEFTKNESLQQEGFPAQYLYISLTGLLREHIAGENEEDINILFRTGGEGFGATPSLKTGEPAVYSISTIKTSIVARCDGNTFFSLIEKYPEIVEIINTSLDQNYTTIYMRLIHLLKKDIPKQLSGEGELSLELIEALPAYHLASYLRITPESLSRIKKKMKDEKTI